MSTEVAEALLREVGALFTVPYPFGDRIPAQTNPQDIFIAIENMRNYACATAADLDRTNQVAKDRDRFLNTLGGAAIIFINSGSIIASMGGSGPTMAMSLAFGGALILKEPV